MKTFKNKKNPEFNEIIVHFGEPNGEEDLYDDCPYCQELKKKMEAGEIESLGSFSVETERD